MAAVKTHSPTPAAGGAQPDKKTRNRDIPLLSHVMCIMQDICGLEQTREWTHDRLYQTTKYLTGMPGGKGGKGGMEETIAKISAMDDRHAAQLDECAREMEAAEEIMNRIKSPSMRTFVAMYYVRHCSRDEICMELCISEWGFRKAKDAIEKAESMDKVDWHEWYFTG